MYVLCFYSRSNRRNANNRIRGPQSALTDFLASNNIDAHQIRTDFTRRQREAEEQAQQAQPATEASPTPDAVLETTAQAKKRKRQSEKAVEKIKQSKKFQKHQRKAKREPGDSDEGDAAAWDLYQKAKPVPGQRENCAECSSVFTVTGYTKAGSMGGLLCATCSKKAEKEEKSKAKPKKVTAKDKNRQSQSAKLDGIVQRGAKGLVQLCVQTVAANIHEVDDFGEVPMTILDQLSRILSKKRVLTSRTIDLFLNPAYDTVKVYDAAELTPPDFQRIFEVVPGIKHLSLENAGQFKNSVMKYITEHPAVKVPVFRLGAANLIDDEHWRAFFAAKGRYLENFKLTWVDGNFNDETLAQLPICAPQLKRLKLERLFKLTGAGYEHIANMKQLTHLTLRPRDEVFSESLNKIIESIGPQLNVLAMEDMYHLDDSSLAAMHTHCRSLTKFRLTSNSLLTDDAIAALFIDWENPPLAHINLSFCRHLDATQATQNADNIGLCSGGFEALMRHSGASLEHLAVTSARHISHASLMSVFDPATRSYPHLTHICLSFCAGVDDVVLAAIFKSCPKLKRVKVFGCFGVKDTVVPKGVVLLGKPNARVELYEGEDE
ncbi:MAG: hypothetical protein M1817_003630 [Caeruleum heppii]|nr:MAG: hypothetical protein M1817_003630 [Caeruleum heppii]